VNVDPSGNSITPHSGSWTSGSSGNSGGSGSSSGSGNSNINTNLVAYEDGTVYGGLQYYASTSQSSRGGTSGQTISIVGSIASAIYSIVNSSYNGLNKSSTSGLLAYNGNNLILASNTMFAAPPKSSGYVPPKKGTGKTKNGGYMDKWGNEWVKDKSGHGGEHWDVQYPNGGYDNVYPDGTVRRGSGPKGRFSPSIESGDVAKGAVVVGGAYLLYRGVRMIPSLVPPLWWTIPANALAP